MGRGRTTPRVRSGGGRKKNGFRWPFKNAVIILFGRFQRPKRGFSAPEHLCMRRASRERSPHHSGCNQGAIQLFTVAGRRRDRSSGHKLSRLCSPLCIWMHKPLQVDNLPCQSPMRWAFWPIAKKRAQRWTKPVYRFNLKVVQCDFRNP